MKLHIALAALVVSSAAATAGQAAPASQSAAASANIVAAQQLTKTRDLVFGTIAKPTSGTSTITVASGSSGAVTPAVTGGNATIPTTGQASSAAFHITAAAGTTFTIDTNSLSFPTAGANLTSIGSETPAMSGITLAGATYTLTGADGDLFIGGHFDITPTTAVGAYNGTLSLTVNFN
jgi:hypothetical protein